MTHSCVWHDSFMCVTWLIHVCDMTHSCAWHESFMCVTWLAHVCDMTRSCVWHDSFSCMPWLFHVGDMTHPCVWEDSFMCVTETRLMQRATWYSNHRITHSCAWRDSCIIIIFMTWRVHHYHVCVCVWHDLFICVKWLIRVCAMTTKSCRRCSDDGMGWLRLVGSSNLQVSLAEYSLFNRALLQKRPIILRSLLIVATP